MKAAYVLSALLSAVLASGTLGGCVQSAKNSPAPGPDHASSLCRMWASAHHTSFASMNGGTAAGAASYLSQLHAPPVPWLSRVASSEFVAVCVGSTPDPSGLCFNGAPVRDVHIAVIDDHKNHTDVRLGRPAAASPCPSPSPSG